MTNQEHFDSNLQRAAALERWIVAQLFGLASEYFDLTSLPFQARSERLSLVRDILDRNPRLAQTARGLSAYDQLRLTLEFVRTNESVAAPVRAVGHPILVASVRTSARCVTRHGGQGPTRRQT